MRERWARATPACILAIYFAVFTTAASRRAFWFDEIFTAYLAGLPTTFDLWRALAAGADLAPPLFHLVTRACASLPLDPQVALRLPALVGFGLMCACLFVFVRRRCGTLCAAIAMLVPILCPSSRYAIEARPYGLVLGCMAMAVLCWQSAVEGRRRAASLAGLAVSAAAAVALHYYAILLLLPIAAGEAVRLARGRRPDWGVWAASAAAPITLAAHLPLFALSKSYLHNAWAAPRWQALVKFFGQITGPVVLVCLFGAVLFWWLARRSGKSEAPGAPVHEWAAAGALAAMPLFVYSAAVAFTGIFVGRYALAAMMGLAILLAFVLHAAPSRPLRNAGFAAALGLALVVNSWDWLRVENPSMSPAVLARANRETPIVSGSAFRFLELAYYSPSAGVRYLAGPTEARRQTGSDAPDLGLLALRPWAAIPVEPYHAFMRTRQPFLLYWAPDESSWLLAELRDAGASLRLVAQDRGERLFHVEWPASSGPQHAARLAE